MGIVSAIGFPLIGTIELATVLCAARIVPIGHAIAMHRVVLPFVVVDPVVGIDVVVAIDVDVDVVIAPVTFTPQGSNDRHTGAKRESGHQRLTGVIGRWRWIVRGRRCRVGPGAVGGCRVIGGDVHHLRIGRLNDDGGVAGRGRFRGRCRVRGRRCRRRDILDRHVLILVALQIAGGLCLATQALGAFHEIVGLRQEGITQALDPDGVLPQHYQNLREGDQRLHARIQGWFATCLTASSPLASGCALDQLTASPTSPG